MKETRCPKREDDRGAQTGRPDPRARFLLFWGAVAAVMVGVLVMLWNLPAPGLRE